MSKTKRSRFKVLDDGNPDGDGDARVEHVGAEIRRARIEKGLTVPFLAETLRIREAFLVAIEEGHYDRLPGPAYALGFVRSYAGYLGLDGREMVERFKDEARSQPRLGRTGRLSFPSPLAEGRGPFGALLVIALLLGALVYGGWYWYSNRDASLEGLGLTAPGRVEAPVRPAAPADVQEAAQAAGPESDRTATAVDRSAVSPALPATPRATTGAGSTEPRPAPLSSGATVPVPAGSGSIATAGGSPGGGAAQAGASVPPATPGQAPIVSALPAPSPTSQAPVGSDGGGSSIVINAKRDSWIQVRDETGTMLTSAVLRAGETYRVPNRPGLTLMTGNAGGIEIIVDGRTLPPLGPEGTIRRKISLDRDKLLSLAP
jgi:cytoskeleton protein RodZ